MDFGLFRFASPPRTATTWIRKAANSAGLVGGSRVAVHVPFDGQVGGQLKVSCVRHPCDWFSSYYVAVYPGSVNVPIVDAFRQTSPGLLFDQFIRSYLRHMPGGVGRLFELYQADSYLPVENLPWAFVELLEGLGISKRMREKCLELGPQNDTRRDRLPVWSPSLHAKVIEVEAEFMERFEYI